MQFGRTFGSALMILGLILICVQAWMSLYSGNLHPEQLPAHTEQQRSDKHHLPGIIGTVVLIGGLVLFTTRSRGDQDRPARPVN